MEKNNRNFLQTADSITLNQIQQNFLILQSLRFLMQLSKTSLGPHLEAINIKF